MHAFRYLHIFRIKDDDILDLPRRKSQRLINYDYSQNGAYFITICTYGKNRLFGEIIDGQMILNSYGNIAEKHIQIMDNLRNDIKLDNHVVMPNHIHMIIVVCRERIACVPDKDTTKAEVPKMIQSYKASVTKEIRETYGTHAMRSLHKQIWLKSYHDHIIRNDAEYQKVWEYIDTNPLKWELDKYYG